LPIPKVSIGLPVYNGENYLEEALTSLLDQTFSDFELIISDNASTDRTQEICRAYEADPRVRYCRNSRNQGASWNLNRVVELSRGDYFKWAAHDDLCGPEFLERCVAVLDRSPSVVLCSTETIIIDGQGKHLRRYVDPCDIRSPRAHERFRNVLYNLGLSNCIYGVVRTGRLRMTRLHGAYFYADAVLLAELGLLGPFWRVPEYLFYRRDHPQRACRLHSVEEIVIWLDPENEGKTDLFKWRLCMEHLRGISRAPISRYQKACCYGHVARWLTWKRYDLLNEWFQTPRGHRRRDNHSAKET
jgi:glycosyltransferase involved in cell wall biosynthesis